MFRSPVLIVTDASFNLLYGPSRIKLKCYKTSVEFFRRVIPVLVDESAGPSLVALAAEGASKTPWAVIFPYRYLEGAAFYKENHADIPVFVMAGRSPKPRGESDLVFVCTDFVQDLYRAGLCAALLAGDKRVVFLNDENFKNEHFRAFREGLRFQGFLDDPYFISAYQEYSSNSDVGCAVIAGPAVKFLEEDRQIPLILFSWLDPVQLPRTVKLVFDDSPWAMAATVLKLMPLPEAELFLPSEPVILLGKDEKKNFRNFESFIKEKFENN